MLFATVFVVIPFIAVVSISGLFVLITVACVVGTIQDFVIWIIL